MSQQHQDRISVSSASTANLNSALNLPLPSLGQPTMVIHDSYSPAAMHHQSAQNQQSQQFAHSQFPFLPTPQGTPMNALAQRPKRHQVKNACVNCQKACKKCDDGRPCQRCIKHGLTATCVDSPRKPRKKGIKRGPYKRRKQLNQPGQPNGDDQNAAGMVPNGALPSLSSSAPHFNPHAGAYDAASALDSASAAAAAAAYGYGYHNNHTPALHQEVYGQPLAMYAPDTPQHSTPQHTTPNSPWAASPVHQGQAHQGASPILPQHNGDTAHPQPQSGHSSQRANQGNDQEQEGAKLSILSQLCSAVLHEDRPSPQQQQQQLQQHQQKHLQHHPQPQQPQQYSREYNEFHPYPYSFPSPSATSRNGTPTVQSPRPSMNKAQPSPLGMASQPHPSSVNNPSLSAVQNRSSPRQTQQQPPQHHQQHQHQHQQQPHHPHQQQQQHQQQHQQQQQEPPFLPPIQLHSGHSFHPQDNGYGEMYQGYEQYHDH
ncbi:uncharacterized protein VTP21DRAFT_4501 [Calcarisporiella thermophila]|uniref:uncharacterized protein n=1 Tax=Calcarisporiella thermophila TaxID=911321 RepID=UPI0037443C87